MAPCELTNRHKSCHRKSSNKLLLNLFMLIITYGLVCLLGMPSLHTLTVMSNNVFPRRTTKKNPPFLYYTFCICKRSYEQNGTLMECWLLFYFSLSMPHCPWCHMFLLDPLVQSWSPLLQPTNHFIYLFCFWHRGMCNKSPNNQYIFDG